MADERQTQASLSKIMEQYNLPDQKLASLFNYLQQRLLDFKEHKAYALLHAIENSSEHRRNLPLQEFGHTLHLHSLYAQQGDTSREVPTLPQEMGDVELEVDLSSDTVDADTVIMMMIVEWVQQETGHLLSMNGGASVIVEKEPASSALQIKESNPVPAGRPELNESSLLELSKVNADILAHLTSDEIYSCQDGQQAINKKLVLSLVDAKTQANALRKFSLLLPDFNGFGRENLSAIDFERVDGRMTFCTIAEAVAACLVLAENGDLRVGALPEKKRDTNSDALNEQLKQELQGLNQEIANFLLEHPYTLKKSGLIAISKRLVCQLFDAQNAQEATTKLNYFFPDLVNYTRKDIENNDDVDGHLRLYSLADTFQIVSWILESGRLRADYATPYPAKWRTGTSDVPPSDTDSSPHSGDTPAPEEASDAPEETESPTPEDTPIDEAPQQDPVDEVSDTTSEHDSSSEYAQPTAISSVQPSTSIPISRAFPPAQNLDVRPPTPTRQVEKMVFTSERPVSPNEGFSRQIREEIVTLMTTSGCTFGAHNKWVQDKLFPHVVRTADNRYYALLSNIHMEILGGALTELFDASFVPHVVSSHEVGPAAFNKPGKYMELEHALRYIHKGARRPDVRLQID